MENKNVTLNDVRNEAMDVIEKLKNNNIDIASAKEIRSLLDTITNTARVQIDFLNSLPKHLKDTMTNIDTFKIAGTLNEQNISPIARVSRSCELCRWEYLCREKKKCSKDTFDMFESK